MLLCNRESFLVNFAREYYELVKAGNCEHFFENEGQDVEQRKFFTVNNKHCMVYCY